MYYVLFTMLVLVASAILFKEFNDMAVLDIVGLLCGFATIVSALYLINFVSSSTINDKQWLKSFSEKNSEIKLDVLENST